MSDWNKDRKDYREGLDAVTGEAGWTLKRVFIRVLLPLMLFGAAAGTVAYALGWFGDAAQVARDEFGPKAALKKYEWFVNQAAAIDKMDADIKLFEARAASVERQYAAYGAPAAWPPDVRARHDRESEQARDDLTAVISQRNNLVREYDAQSEKFNWEPFNARSDMPKPRYDETPLP